MSRPLPRLWPSLGGLLVALVLGATAAVAQSSAAPTAVLTATPSNTTTATNFSSALSQTAVEGVSAAFISFAYTSALIGTPCATLQIHRAIAVLSLSRCDFTHDEELSFPLSVWPGFSTGAPVAAFYRGAVIANLATALIFTVLGLIVVLLLGWCAATAPRASKARRHTAVQAGMMALRFPASLIVPCGLLIPSLVTASVATLIYGDGFAADLLLSVAGALLCVLYVVGLFYMVEFLVPSRGIPLELPHPWHFGWRSAFFGFDRSWVPRAPTPNSTDMDPQVVVEAVGPLVQPFDASCRWYVALEALGTVACSAILGIMPNTTGTCQAALGAIIAPLALVLVIVVWRRPDRHAPIREAFNTTAMVMLLLGAVLCVVAFATQTSALLAAGQVMSLFSAATHAATSFMAWGKIALNAFFGPLPPVGAPARPRRAMGGDKVQLAGVGGSTLLGLTQAFDPLLDAAVAQELLSTNAGRDEPVSVEDGFVVTPAAAEAATAQLLDTTRGANIDDDPPPPNPFATTGAPPPLPGYLTSTPMTIFRTAEGQRLHDELTTLFRHGAVTTQSSTTPNSIPTSLDDLL